MVKFNARSRVRDMRERDDSELRAEMEKLKKEMFDLRLKSSTEAVANTARFSHLRRDIARINTLLRERELKKSAK